MKRVLRILILIILALICFIGYDKGYLNIEPYYQDEYGIKITINFQGKTATDLILD